MPVKPSAAAPAGQILAYSCPRCEHKGVYYYTDLALYDNDRDPGEDSILPEHAPAVPGSAIDADADAIVCPNESCGLVQFRHVAFELLPSTAVRARRSTSADDETSTLVEATP
ncbi:hypothetical protein [Halorubrum sp. CSM-61]|uniref:hypothetical protein n=1 Tax=Halorubrum sp. CSM-61 TaxID=2485838 RepID=UPI000F4BA179|nr:hypothetical protein [Halorubrum sp. CSM-61]